MNRLTSMRRAVGGRGAQRIAHLVAPRRPLDRVGIALVLTATLAGVQVAFGIGNAGLALCRLAAGDCGHHAAVAGGRAHGNPPSNYPSHPRSTLRRPSGRAPSSPPSPQTTVALRMPSDPPTPTAVATGLSNRGFAAARPGGHSASPSRTKKAHGRAKPHGHERATAKHSGDVSLARPSHGHPSVHVHKK